MILGTWGGSLLKEYSEPARIVYTHQDYVDLVGTSGEVSLTFRGFGSNFRVYSQRY